MIYLLLLWVILCYNPFIKSEVWLVKRLKKL